MRDDGRADTPDAPDAPDGDDEFERTPLPGSQRLRRPSRRIQWPRRRPRQWRVPASLAAVVLLLALLFGLRGSTVAERHPPIQIAAAPWQRIPLPAADGRAVHTIAPSPSDPNILYACVGPLIGASYPAALGPVWLFRTRDAGAHWDLVPTPPLAGSWCSVTVSATQPERISVLVHHGFDSSSGVPVCAETTTYLSEDGGQTWRTLPRFAVSAPAGAADAYCSDWMAEGARFVLISYGVAVKDANGMVREPHTLLERSDDGGHTWQRADAGLPARTVIWRFLAGGPEADASARDGAMVVMLLRYEGTIGTTFEPLWEIWRTADAGHTWRHVRTIALPGAAGGFPIIRAPQQHPAYVVSGDQVPASLFHILILQLTPDFAPAGAVPPLPVPGATPDRTGLLQVLGTLPDGRVFALGVSPDRGVPAAPSSTDPAPNPSDALASSWVWIWDPVAVRWAVVMSPLEVAPHRGYGCGGCWEASLSRGSGRDARGGTAGGTAIWLRDWSGAESAAYRLFVPDA